MNKKPTPTKPIILHINLAGGFMVFPQPAFLGFPYAMVLKEQH